MTGKVEATLTQSTESPFQFASAEPFVTYFDTGNVQDTVKALQTNVGKIVQSLGILYKWWVIAIVVIINILVLLSLRGARQTVIVQAPQSVQGTSVQPKTLPCESTQPQLEKSDEMKIF